MEQIKAVMIAQVLYRKIWQELASDKEMVAPAWLWLAGLP